jgi:cyclopropane-fatty-acyl-phospholipid synthase
MTGAGDYDSHSEYQRRVASAGTGLVEEAAPRLPPPASDATFVIVDYGASTGRNSLAVMRAAISAVRSRNAGQPVVAVHNDVPTNDWNQLFANLTSDTDSYLHLEGPAAVPVASAVSFFEPAMPTGSVHVGMSFSAVHWLRSQPSVVVPDGFYFCEAAPAERAVLAAQADADWTAFLAARAADLTKGGRLVVQMVGSQPGAGGQAPDVTARKLLRAMNDLARDLVAAGRLDADVCARYILPVYARTPGEAREPFERAGSPVAGCFTVDRISADPVDNPYLTQWRKDGDAQAYGAAYAGFVRAFTESNLREHLFTPGARGGEDPGKLLDEYFDRLTARFAANPLEDVFEDWTLTVAVTRR